MSLEDLIHCAADQEKSIESVFAAGERERKAGREETKSYRSNDQIDDFTIVSEDPFDLPLDPGLPPAEPEFNLVPVGHQVLKIPQTLSKTSGERNNPILIWSKYDHAGRAALLARGTDTRLFLVTSQPGIIKTVFLFRLLIRRLSLKLRTVLQLVPDHALLFHSKGVNEFEQLANPGPYAKFDSRFHDPHENIRTFVDSNTVLIQPDGIFTERTPFFVVETSSHRNVRLEWMKETTSQVFYLKPWTFPEVVQARTLLSPIDPPEECELWYLYKTYSASCRLLFKRATCPERYLALVQSAVESVEDIVHILTLLSYVTEASHFVVFLESSPPDRSLCQTKIITRTVFEMVWKRRKNLFEGRSSMTYSWNIQTRLPLLDGFSNSGCIIYLDRDKPSLSSH